MTDLFAVVNERNQPVVRTIRETKQDAIQAFLTLWRGTKEPQWHELAETYGYKVQPVLVSVVTDSV